ncbi:sugar ABC transporter substrate-binding protein [Marinactinospora rubrisoli]|uniref:Sugar ABC transporter substrate-binding protein n=1 Tax=Marinactinospora rubrisoli TaxID=2715399 RepID=A0ABW2KGG0_9ACTN
MHRAARTAPAAIALALAASACAGSGGGQVAADEEQTITVWAMGAEGERLAEVAQAYEADHPGITVEVTPIGWDIAHQKLVSAAAAGELPDIAQMGSTYLGEFAALGVLEPVGSGTADPDSFFPAAWEQVEVDGTAYGVPWYVDTRVLYYRTDLAEEAGIDEAPATWQELGDAARAYQDEAGTRWGISLQPGGLDAVQSFFPFLYSAGGAIVDDDGRSAIADDASVRALAEYGSYFEDGLANRSVQPGYDVLKDFGTGDVPMFLSGPWMVTSLNEQYPDLDGRWDVAPVPADETSTSMAGGSSLVVFQSSRHKAAAQEFVAALTDAEAQADWYHRTSNLPASTEAWQDEELAGNAVLQVFREQMESAIATPTLANWTEISAQADTAIEAVARGTKSARDAAAEADQEIETLLEQVS